MELVSDKIARLDIFISENASVSRSRAETLIKRGMVSVNDVVRAKAGYEGFGFGPFGGFGAYQAYQSEACVRARELLSQGRYREALDLLYMEQNRDALWFYLAAKANEGLGNRLNALDYAKKAAAMEPGNLEYAMYASRLDPQAAGGPSQSYRTRQFDNASAGRADQEAQGGFDRLQGAQHR